MRIFKTKVFEQFTKQKAISDEELSKAIENAEKGLIDAYLGGNLIKQRIPRLNKGKSSGYRSIILYRNNNHSFFIYGFSKNNQANISLQDLDKLKMLAKQLAVFSD